MANVSVISLWGRLSFYILYVIQSCIVFELQMFPPDEPRIMTSSRRSPRNAWTKCPRGSVERISDDGFSTKRPVSANSSSMEGVLEVRTSSPQKKNVNRDVLKDNRVWRIFQKVRFKRGITAYFERFSKKKQLSIFCAVIVAISCIFSSQTASSVEFSKHDVMSTWENSPFNIAYTISHH